MNNSPLVSIICTSYNHEAYIKDALEGFIMQKTNFPFEIIVHDDASTDSTAEIIHDYEIKYPELFVNIYQTENQYSKGNGEVGKIVFNAIRGNYVAFCEGDDYWTDPLKLQKQVDYLENHKDYGLVWTDIDFFIQSSGVLNKAVFKNKIIPFYNSFIDVLINKSFLAPATWVLRKDYLPKESNDYCDGTFAWILDILAVTKIKYLDEVTAVYRELSQSASHITNSRNRYKRYQGIYRIQKDTIKKYNLPEKIEEEIDLNYFETTFHYVVAFDDKSTIKRGKAILKNSHTTNLNTRIALFLSNYSIGKFAIMFLFNIRDKCRSF